MGRGAGERAIAVYISKSHPLLNDIMPHTPALEIILREIPEEEKKCCFGIKKKEQKEQ